MRWGKCVLVGGVGCVHVSSVCVGEVCRPAYFEIVPGLYLKQTITFLNAFILHLIISSGINQTYQLPKEKTAFFHTH